MEPNPTTHRPPHSAASPAASRVVLTGEAAGGLLAAVATTLPPGAGWLRHRHRHDDELVTVLGGALDVVYLDRRHHIGAGQSLYLPRGIAHAIVAGDDGATLLTVLAPSGFEHAHHRLCTPIAPADFETVVAVAARHACDVTGPAPTLSAPPRQPRVRHGGANRP